MKGELLEKSQMPLTQNCSITKMQDRQVGVDIDFGVDNDVENVETVSFSYLEKNLLRIDESTS